jgi:hypothetical protein
MQSGPVDPPRRVNGSGRGADALDRDREGQAQVSPRTSMCLRGADRRRTSVGLGCLAQGMAGQIHYVIPRMA